MSWALGAAAARTVPREAAVHPRNHRPMSHADGALLVSGHSGQSTRYLALVLSSFNSVGLCVHRFGLCISKVIGCVVSASGSLGIRSSATGLDRQAQPSAPVPESATQPAASRQALLCASRSRAQLHRPAMPTCAHASSIQIPILKHCFNFDFERRAAGRVSRPSHPACAACVLVRRLGRGAYRPLGTRPRARARARSVRAPCLALRLLSLLPLVVAHGLVVLVDLLPRELVGLPVA